MLKMLISFVMLAFSYVGYGQEEPVKLNTERVLAVFGPVMQPTLGLVPQLMDLSKASPGEPIDLVISSPGGRVDVGFLLISVMDHVRASGTPIRCFVPDLAASMAFQLLLHCDERYVLKRSTLLFHRVRVQLGGGLFSQGVVLTGPDAGKLSKDLLAVDRSIWDDLVTSLPVMPEKEMLYHFNHETAHVASNLCEATGGSYFQCVDYVEGLMPYMMDLLEQRKAGRGEEDKKNSTTPPGTIIYMLPPTIEQRSGGL